MKPDRFSFKGVVLALLVYSSSAYDKGFELLYRSNDAEFHDLPVTFDTPLPTWMNGTVFHNGLGLFEMGSRNVTHFFDGFAKIHSWKLQGGTDKALFTTTFVRTGYYNDSVSMEDIAPYTMFAQPEPRFGIRDRMKQVMNGMDNANINLLRMGDDLVALSDMPVVYVIEESALKTLARIDAPIKGITIMAKQTLSTSHPVPEHGTKNWINIINEPVPFMGSSLHIVRCIGASYREPIATIKLSFVPYMHSFAATEKYVIIFVNPVSLDLTKLLITGEPLEALTFTENMPTDVYIIEIATGKVQVLKTEPFFAIHLANAFAMSSDSIAIDAVTYPDVDIVKKLKLNILLDPIDRNTIPFEKALLKRYVIDLSKQTVTVQNFPTNPSVPAALKFDFPVFNEVYRFKPYCFIYGVTIKVGGLHSAKWALVKKDTCNPEGDKMWYKENHYPGEPWFVPHPLAEKEDDGLVMVVILDGEKEQSYLAVFDAQDLKLVNKAYLRTYLPMTIHGRYLEDK